MKIGKWKEENGKRKMENGNRKRKWLFDGTCTVK